MISVTILYAGLVPTLASNSPADLVPVFGDPDTFRQLTRFHGHGDATAYWEWLRWVPSLVFDAFVLNIPIVFWVCSLTRFHEVVAPAGSTKTTPGRPTSSLRRD